MAQETASPSTTAPNNILGDQTLAPSYLTGTFLSDDTDNHDFAVDGRGKSKITLAISTTGTSSYNAIIYGAPAANSTVGVTGVIQVTSTANLSDGGILNGSSGVFPFYIARLQKSNTGEDGSAITVSVYINLVN